MLQSKNGVFYAVFWLLINYLASTDSIDLKLVSSLRSLLYLNRLILICKLENNLAAKKMLLQHSLELDELGSASVFRGTASFLDAVSVSYLANNSVVFCAQDFDAEAFLSRSRKFGVKQPWVIVHKYDDEAAVARLGKFFNLNQQMFFFDLRTKQLSESYEIGGAAVSRNLGTLTLLNGNYAFSRDVKQGFLQRRSNLMGKRLKIVVDNQNPYLNLPQVRKVQTESSHTINTVIFRQDLDLSSKFTTPSGDEIIPLSHDEISGVFFEQTMVLSRELNFSTSYFRRVDRVWGTYISQGNVTGMVGSAYKVGIKNKLTP